jgi:hypothetical protein
MIQLLMELVRRLDSTMKKGEQRSPGNIEELARDGAKSAEDYKDMLVDLLKEMKLKTDNLGGLEGKLGEILNQKDKDAQLMKEELLQEFKVMKTLVEDTRETNPRERDSRNLKEVP